MRLRHHNQPSPQTEYNILQTREQRHILQTQELVNRALYLFADMASGSYDGLPLTRASMDEFDFNKLPMPQRHIPGYVRGARFIDGLLLRATTANGLSDSLHTFSYDGVPSVRTSVIPTYQRTSINEDFQALGTNIAKTQSLQDIAAIPNIAYDLGKIQSSLEIEKHSHWPHAIGLEQLSKIRRTDK